MIRKRSTVEELDEYTKEQEEKDINKFDKLLEKLSNPQSELLLQILLDQYPPAELTYLLDSLLEPDIKEELGEIWAFRTQSGFSQE